MSFLIQWVDAIWLLLAFVFCQKKHWPYAIGFVLSGMLMMRMMAELMSAIGYPNGIIGLMDLSVFWRGQIIFNLFYALFMVLSHLSPNAKGPILLAGSISLFFAASVAFSCLMVL